MGATPTTSMIGPRPSMVFDEKSGMVNTTMPTNTRVNSASGGPALDMALGTGHLRRILWSFPSGFLHPGHAGVSTGARHV